MFAESADIVLFAMLREQSMNGVATAELSRELQRLEGQLDSNNRLLEQEKARLEEPS